MLSDFSEFMTFKLFDEKINIKKETANCRARVARIISPFRGSFLVNE